MNETLGNSTGSHEKPDSEGVYSVEPFIKDHATDPGFLTDAELVALFLDEVGQDACLESSASAAAAINRLLERDADKRDSDTVAERRAQVTLERIAMVESSIEDGDLFHDDVVLAIVKRLQDTRSRAQEFEESRKALRKMIDIRALAVESGADRTEADVAHWMSIIDTLHHL